MPPSRKWTVLVADDHAMVAEGIARTLSEQYEVLGIAPDGRRLLEMAATMKPDLICMDISMPELSGIHAAIQLAELLPRTKIIFVTQQVDLAYLRAAFRAGALGFVAKQSASAELTTAVKQVLLGNTFITPLLADELSISPEQLKRDLANVFTDALTPRQREILQLIAEGKTTKEMSAALSISLKTVEFHKNGLMNELGLRSTADLTRYAIAHGLVGLGQG